MSYDLVNESTGEVLTVQIPNPIRARARVRTEIVGESRTHQEMAEKTDVNYIINRMKKTGEISHLNTAKPWYGDFSLASDYLDAHDRIEAANEAFMKLPAEVRAACGNNAAELIRLAYEDPEGLKKLEDAGLPIGGGTESAGAAGEEGRKASGTDDERPPGSTQPPQIEEKV